MQAENLIHALVQILQVDPDAQVRRSGGGRAVHPGGAGGAISGGMGARWSTPGALFSIHTNREGNTFMAPPPLTTPGPFGS